MKNKILKLVIINLLLLVLTLSSATAMSIGELVDSYDYSHDAGVLVITHSDNMIDTNNNNINDELQIKLNAQGVGTYQFIVDLEDNNRTFTRTQTHTLSDNDQIAIAFDTSALQSDQFRYAVRVYNQNEELVYRTNFEQTNSYSNYEGGIELLSIADSKSNEGLTFVFDLTTPKALSNKATLVLEYADQRVIQSQDVQLNQGTNSIKFHVPHQKIAQTHHTGTFKATSLIIGEQNLALDHTTNSYNYEEFATTSYLKTILSNPLYEEPQDETNPDNQKIKQLDFSFITNIKQMGEYTIEAQIYDLNEAQLTTISTTKELKQGIHNIIIPLLGEDIYKTRLNGPYLVFSASLIQNEQVVDQIFNAHTTENFQFTDFVPPPRPDLTIEITNYDHNEQEQLTSFSVITTNQGQAPAFNVFIDVFDSLNFEQEESIAKLDVDESIITTITHPTQEQQAYFAAVDFENIVDEENETNNIVYYEDLSINCPNGYDGSENCQCTTNQQCELGNFCQLPAGICMQDPLMFLLSEFSDQSTTKLIQGQSASVTFTLPKNAKIIHAQVTARGESDE